MPLNIISDTDVYRRLGGLPALVQLLPDTTSPDTYDSTALTALREDATQEVVARANVQVDIKTLHDAVQAGTATWPPYLVDLCAWQCAIKVWDCGSKGQALPERYVEKERWIKEECQQVRQRLISLGVVTESAGYPGSNILHRTVDMDPNQTRLTVGNFGAAGGFL